jgi:hypothetical protein
LALAVLLQGCAAAGLAVVGAGAGVGMGTGVEHELNGVGYKTFATPIRFCASRSPRHLGEACHADHRGYAHG